MVEPAPHASVELDRKCIDRLRRRMQDPLPGRAAQRRFEPSSAYGRHFDRPSFDCRTAAVVVAAYPHVGQWCVPLTVRPDYMPVHAGQICFPGGMIDDGEASAVSALRELEEELGVTRSVVEVLGPLTPLYVFGTRIFVEPWLAVVAERPEFRPSEFEVAELLEIPLDDLAAPENRGEHARMIRGLSQTVPHLAWREHRIWGATAMMLGEVISLWNECRNPNCTP